MHVPRVTRYTFLIALFLIITATAGVFIASHVFADIPYQEAHPFIITPNNHSFALIAGETATTSFVVGALGYTSQYSLDTYPSCVTYDDTNGNCIEYAADSLLCDYISLTDLDGEDEYKSLNDETDPTDAWMLTLSAPCIEGACPEGHNDDYQPPLPRALVGTELSCDIRVGGRPVFVKAGIFDTFVHRFSDAVTAFAASSPYYVLHVTATITEASSTPACTEHCYSNVAFIPGIQASRLFKQGMFFENRLWEPNRDNDVRELLMTDTGKSDNPDIYTKAGDDGIIDEVFGFHENIYKSFLADLDVWKNDDHLIADYAVLPYDWRLAFSDVLAGGKVEDGKVYYDASHTTAIPYIYQELERLAATSKSGKVTIVAHSMGGLLVKKLFADLEDNPSHPHRALLKKIDTVVLAATPQLGTPKAVASLLHGYDQGNAWGIINNAQTVRDVGKNMPSAYTLLPSSMYFDRVHDVATSGEELSYTTIIGRDTGDITTYTALKAYLTDPTHAANNPNDTLLPIAVSYGFTTRAQELHDRIDSWHAPDFNHDGAPDIRVVQIAGWGLKDTVRGMEYVVRQRNAACPPGVTGTCRESYADPEPIFTGDGDGTVVTPSAVAMSLITDEVKNVETWYVDLQKYNQLSELNTNRNHGSILEVSEVRSLIHKLIQGLSSPGENYRYLKSNPDQLVPEGRFIRLAIHSPATLDLYDTEGSHVGIAASSTAERTIIDTDIPNSYYLQFGEGKYLGAPLGWSTTVVVVGTGSGTFALEMSEESGDTMTAKRTFSDIPVSTTTRATLTFGSVSDVASLAVDSTGDGIVDFVALTDEQEKAVSFTTLKNVIAPLDTKTKKLLLAEVAVAEALAKKKNKNAAIVLLHVLKKEVQFLMQDKRKDAVQVERIKGLHIIAVIDALILNQH